ncbi:hypothetical protein KW795_02530 [Candidatus Microgenomates bacterium]|nr:hypothetical protein [Candidatus Microgenomates bacterium]
MHYGNLADKREEELMKEELLARYGNPPNQPKIESIKKEPKERSDIYG